jgi:hypothetical protein
MRYQVATSRFATAGSGFEDVDVARQIRNEAAIVTAISKTSVATKPSATR